MKIIVGYTGFVGSNICANMKFDNYYNSKNIKESYGLNPDLLVYAGLKAEKYMANLYPYEDFKLINEAINNIKNINPKKIVFISTIDVYDNSKDKNEDDEDVNKSPYGLHRYYLEKYIEENYTNHLIIRLPALFGINIKKNFLYDLKTLIPYKIKTDKYNELIKKSKDLSNFYDKEDNNFYKIKDNINKEELKKILEQINFTSLNFTDQDNVYQFLNLGNLSNIIKIALKNNIKKLNVATEPIKASEIYKYVYNKKFNNKITNQPCYYNFKTKYYKIFNGKNGYIYDKERVLKDVKKFIQE